MPIKKVESKVPKIAKLKILFAEDFISRNLICSELAKSKKLKSIPSTNLEKSMVERLCFIEMVKSSDSSPAKMSPTETMVPISIKLIPGGSFNTLIGIGV